MEEETHRWKVRIHLHSHSEGKIKLRPKEGLNSEKATVFYFPKKHVILM